jgi:hypothetical protein
MISSLQNPAPIIYKAIRPVGGTGAPLMFRKGTEWNLHTRDS